MRPLALVLVLLALTGCGADEPASDSPPAGGGTAPGGGLFVEDVVEDPPDDFVLVQGNLVYRDGQPRLCSAVLESYPPQCGEPSLAIEGGESQVADVENGNPIELYGHVVDGVIHVLED